MSPSADRLNMLKADGDSREPCHKKRRLDHQSSSPLSEAIQSLSGPPCIIALKKILHHLDAFDTLSHCDFPVKEMQSLYRTLLLYVGYTLSLSSDNTNQPNSDPELLLALCHCWQRVVDITLKFNISLYLHDSERIQSVELLSQVLEMHHDHVCIASKCLDVAQHTAAVDTEGHRQERLLFSILRIVTNESYSGVSEKAMSILETAATNYKSRTARIVYAAARIIQTCKEGTNSCQKYSLQELEEDLDSEMLTLGFLIIERRDSAPLTKLIGTIVEDDLMLFLRGLSLSSNVADHLANSTLVIGILFSKATKYKHDSKSAVDCLSSIACCGGHSKLLVDKLIALLTDDASPMAQKTVIPGVYACLQKDSSILFGEETNSIISSLIKLIENEYTNVNDENWLLDAARLLSFIASQLASKREWSTSLEQSIHGLILILERRDSSDCVLSVSLDCLLKLSFDKCFKRRMAHLNNLPTSIAKVATADFVAIKTKSTAIQILSKLAEEKSTLPLLARSSHVLEALIAFASTDADATLQNNARKHALQTILTLSELVSNRRILAKQVGLLACLIRYVRSNEANLLLPKDKLKDRILEIAVLL